MDLESNHSPMQRAINLLTKVLDGVKDGSIDIRCVDVGFGEPLLVSAQCDTVYERSLTINFTMKGDLDVHHQ